MQFMFLTLIAAAGAMTQHNWAERFVEWKVEHGKVYSSAALEAKAFSAWTANEDKILEHNNKGLSYWLGHNEFSDMTEDEFTAKYLGYQPGLRATPSGPMHVADPNATLPASIDWVEKGAVTPVKNQGQCGSCWAFSTTGSVEGAYAIASGKLVSLSEQELVQCDSVDQGCAGGLMDNAFKYVEKSGLAPEKSYPYTSGTGIRGICDTKQQAEPAVHVTGFKDVTPDDEEALQSAVALGPVSVAIEADKKAFQLYKGGVLLNPLCGHRLDHGVLVVGYGTDTTGLFKKTYWKVKNSWGPNWGEKGYIRIYRGTKTSKLKNICGIASQPSYPTGAAAGAPSMVEA